jgi:pantoate--beta-alanine ligase
VALEVIRQPAAWRAFLDAQRIAGRSIGLVPTMGALHAGHLSLIRRAAADRDVAAMTDYVNPLQFGPAEDLAAYPRDLERDCELAEHAGATAVFAPSTADLWPAPPATAVRVEGVTQIMEGAARPGHFDGVATIVTKLLSLTGPCWAYFGEKDFQQLTVIRRLVVDLSLPVEVIGCPIVRDPDGLALSSRNAYLTEEERAAAPHLYYALLAGKRAIEDDGVRDPAAVRQAMAASLATQPLFELDYAEVVDADTFEAPTRIHEEARLCVAARIGKARLIDNISATPPTP